MLPPIAPSVLESNPKFKALYTNLAGSRLNADASTRLIKQQRAQADIEKQLTTSRKEAAERILLQHGLQTIASRTKDLPPELLESCYIVSAQLNGQLSPSDQEILADDIDYFLSNLSTISRILSTHLTETSHLLATLFDPTNPDVTRTPSQAANLADSISTQSTSLALTRTTITQLTTTLHATYTNLLTLSIRHLEQTTHGQISRATRAQAEHLATVAKGLDLKLQILAKTDPMIHNPELQAELGTYKGRLEELAGGLSARIAQHEGVLEQYGKGGTGMLEFARRYAEAKKECENVRLEIEKLEGKKAEVD